LIRHYTSTQLTAEQIHALGRDELQRLRAEIDKVRAQLGSKDDLKTFYASLRADPRFQFASGDEILQTYGAVKERVNANLGNLFADLPQGEFEIRPMVNAAGTAYFTAANPDGSRAGILFVNTSDLASRPKYMAEAVYLHEADPGHRLQRSLQSGLTDLPRFRRFSHAPAYVEGWAMYAESLGRELGLYQDAYQYFGALIDDSRHAASLIVDTGLHAKGWTRDKAIAFMQENTALSDAEIAAEVDRYIARPGQALAYTLGELKIRELRNRAEKRLGSKFDVREFHRAVLNGGAMPLDLLRRKIERWMTTQETAPTLTPNP
jgi:uncharacterized protein (DUF885 family)